MTVNRAWPLESDALRAAPPSITSETVPVGVPVEEPTITVMVALTPYVTLGALIVVVVEGSDEPAGGSPGSAAAEARASMSAPRSFPSLPAFLYRLAAPR